MRIDLEIDGNEQAISVFMDTFFGLMNDSKAAQPVFEDKPYDTEEIEEPEEEFDGDNYADDEVCGDCKYLDEYKPELKVKAEEAAKPKELTAEHIYEHICSAVTASIGDIIRRYIGIPEKMDSKTFELVDNIIDAYSMSAAMLITEAVRKYENRK